MKKILVLAIATLFFKIGTAQTAADLFTPSSTKITWLGVDFSHAKMIGAFNEFNDAGSMSAADIRNRYFSAWNNTLLSEPEKYDFKRILRKEEIANDIDMITTLNAKTPLEEIEGSNTPDYKKEDIAKFVSDYDLSGKSGIGIVFVVESFNKNTEQSIIHFAAINLATKELLVHEKLYSKPRGFGLKNYWLGSIYDAMNQIEKTYYKKWKSQYVK